MSAVLSLGIGHVGGLTGTCTAGAITTLGRGGSDLTATVIAAALGVAEAQVWKDVDGEHIHAQPCPAGILFSCIGASKGRPADMTPSINLQP